MAKRKSIGKKIRFEVFKRDSFTCQYCGDSAPGVILELDHIEPVSKGGNNNILNLITSCRSCNQGKSDRVLSDSSIMLKKKKQLEDLQERKNQLQMMSEWQKSLMDLEYQKVQMINEIFEFRTSWSISEPGKKSIQKIIKQFGITLVSEAVNISIDQYYDGTENSWEKAFKKIGGICYYKQKGGDEILKKAYYIKGIFDNRGLKYHFPIVRLTKDFIDNYGYDKVYKAAITCESADHYLEIVQT